jgi:uncharacterized membrane protein YjgN (DUF898 family)
MNDAVAPPSPPPVVVTRVEFVGVRSEFLRLLLRGAFLEFLTLGFYRFWLATDMRRHMWSHTSAGGDTFEYTGTGKELLLGFLFALAILIPIYLVYFFIGIEAERLQEFASIPLGLFFFLFAQFAFYRARRYRVTRTIWRGVRFWMAGSGWAYAGRAFLWALLVIVTLGLALPWYQAALERYKMRNTYYGELHGRFDGTGWTLFRRFFWLWLATLPAVAAVLALLVSVFVSPYVLIYLLGFVAVEPRAIAALVVVSLVAWPFVYAVYKAREWRWWVNGIRFGDVHFQSIIASGAFVGLYCKVMGWTVLIALVFGAWIAALGISGGLGQGQLTPETVALVVQKPHILIAMAFGYLAAALAFGVVSRLYLRRDIGVRVVSATLVLNLAAAENVDARGGAASALGEGLSDSLDVGGF